MNDKEKYNKTINEIFQLYQKRSILNAFTLESINTIFEIGNEIFHKYHHDEIERMRNRPPSKAPDIFDDEPFSFERTFEIFNTLQNEYEEISPPLIRKIYDLNTSLAWQSYRSKYDDYILSIYRDNHDDPYINYLAAIVLYENKDFKGAFRCINLAINQHSGSAAMARLKGLCLIQNGEFNLARTFFYQSLFLLELNHDIPILAKKKKDIYPNSPVEMIVDVDIVRKDLQNLDKIEKSFKTEILPLIN